MKQVCEMYLCVGMPHGAGSRAYTHACLRGLGWAWGGDAEQQQDTVSVRKADTLSDLWALGVRGQQYAAEGHACTHARPAGWAGGRVFVAVVGGGAVAVESVSNHVICSRSR